VPLRQENIEAEVTPELTRAFERTVSPERWRTYKLAAGFHEETALRLYLWNAAIGQSFHFPLQSTEVALRNVVHASLAALYGPNWAHDPNCRHMLGPQLGDDLVKTERRHHNRYSAQPTTPQMVASLSLGFWVALIRQGFHGSIWASQTANAFPHLVNGDDMMDVSRTGTAIQDLRNRIFHQEPLIGHNLSQDYGDILKMLGWICPETREWVRSHSSVPKVIRERPRR
jgi:hypothetical protein